MVEQDKYYTPTIEEFHVGFEYEWMREGEGATEWTKSVLTMENGPVGDYDAWRVNEYRVKHLNRDDVEVVLNEVKVEEGIDWVVHRQAPDWVEYRLGKGFGIVFSTKYRRVMIEIHNVHGELGKNVMVYNMKVKNKSEFRKIYKPVIEQWINGVV
jgi:hypothetical protein